MNYYPRYPGDYLIKTVDLTMIEDGAYTRLLDWYYSNERPIPHAKRLEVARATTPAARSAVDAVLLSFFVRDGDVWRHGRADEEIAKAAPRIEAAKLNGSKGGRKPKGHPPDSPPDNPTGSPRKNPPGNPNGTQRPSSPEPAPTPEHGEEEHAFGLASARRGDDPEREGHPSPGGLACLAMRQAGVTATNPGNLALLELLRQGATVEEFRAIAEEAVAKRPPLNDPFKWILAVLPKRREEAAAIRLAPAPPPPDWRKTRDGVINRGCALGIGPWSEVDAYNRVGPSWPAYRTSVIEADERQGAPA